MLHGMDEAVALGLPWAVCRVCCWILLCCLAKSTAGLHCVPPIAQVYPLAFKQGMVLAAKCEGFAHGIAVSMPGCNTTQARRRPCSHPNTRAAPMGKSCGGSCLSGCL